MNSIGLHALLPTGTHNNSPLELLPNVGPARNNMAVVEPVAAPFFPIEPATANPTVGDGDDEEHEMLVDEDIGCHPAAENDHSMMDDNTSQQAEEVERPREPTDSIDEKALCPPQMD